MNSQRVCEFMSRNFSEQKITNKYSSIIVYPQNNAREIAKIMADIRIDYLPVLFSPWNKKLIGIIELNKIKSMLKD